jgi:FkbM family methyltransferase
MLIHFQRLPVTKRIKGVIHIGAHECEERDGYLQYFKISDDNIIWIDALEEKTKQMKEQKPSLRIFNECISNKDDETISFMVTNNFQSSSMLNFKTHSIEHPHIHETNRISMKTKKLATFYKENGIISSDFNFMNLDIQGAELLALEGAGDILNDIDYIYTEVNINEVYENCCLLHEIDNFLLKYNFKRVLISMTNHGWGDAFYVKSN